MSRHSKSRTWSVLLGALFALLLTVGAASAQTDPYVTDTGGTGNGGQVGGETADPAKPANPSDPAKSKAKAKAKAAKPNRKAGRLAVTGGDVALFVVVGVTLLASGFALVTVAKRRGAPAA